MIFLWNDDPPVPAGHHSTFTLHQDGSISPAKKCPGACEGDPTRFALGLRGSTCVLVRRDDPKRLFFEKRTASSKVVRLRLRDAASDSGAFPLIDPPSLSGDEFVLVHAASGQAPIPM